MRHEHDVADGVRIDDHAPPAAEVSGRDQDLPSVCGANHEAWEIGEVIALTSAADSVEMDLVGSRRKMREAHRKSGRNPRTDGVHGWRGHWPA